MIQSISSRYEAELHRETPNWYMGQLSFVNWYMEQFSIVNWPFGRVVRFALRAREVSGSIPGTALVVALC